MPFPTYTLTQINTGTGVPSTSSLRGIAYDGTYLWVCDLGANLVIKVSATTGATIATVSVISPFNVCYDGTSVWVTSNVSSISHVTKINPATNSIVASYACGSSNGSPDGICVGSGRIWVCNQIDGNVYAFTASTGALVATISIPGSSMLPAYCCYDGTNIWVANANTTTPSVSKITEASQSLVGTYTTQSPQCICWDGTSVWIGTGSNFGAANNIQKIDPSSGSVIATYTINSGGIGFLSIVSDGTYLWLAYDEPGSITALIAVDTSGTVQQTITGFSVSPPANPYRLCIVANSPYPIIWGCEHTVGTPSWSEIFYVSVSAPATAWLIINEPSIGLTDRTSYLFKGAGNQHNWTQQLRQRGQAQIHLEVAEGDIYTPTRITQAFLYEQTAAGFSRVFAGLIWDIENQYFGNQGDRYIVATAVSMESVFDTIYAEPVQYVDQTCGAIVTDLFNRFEAGCPVTLGTIAAGATIPLFNVNVGDKLSDLFDQLATTSLFTWGVNPATLQLFFEAPSSIAAPFTLQSSDILWDTVNWKVKGADFRNRQGVKLSYDAFAHSMEFFPVTNANQNFTLRRPVEQVTNCYVTLSTCNTATGSFSGQPSPGDTVTTQVAASAWIRSHIYGLGGVISVAGVLYQVTTAGTSGGSIPPFNPVLGATTADFTVVWTSLGPAGLGTGLDIYTFVTALDNTQFGQVLIGASAAATCQNLVDAINANAAVRNNTPNNTVSLPTWENSQCNANYTSGTSFTLQQKAAGSGWVAAISATGSAFSWSGAFTSGGSSPNGNVGLGGGATVSIQVYAVGTNSAPKSLIYTPGSPSVMLSTPLPVVPAGLNIEYTRFDGNVIEVEDSASVAALAALSHGTGRIMQFTDQSQTGLISTSSAAGLQLAQQALAAFGIPPQTFTFDTYRSGLLAGMTLPVELIDPLGAGALLGSGSSPISPINWVIESISAVLLPVPSTGSAPYLPGFGHYKYTVSCVNVSEIGSYLDFWKGQGGGGGGGSSSLSATSGGAISTSAGTGSFTWYSSAITAVAGTPLAIAHGLNSTSIVFAVQDGSSPPNGMTETAIQYSDANTLTLTFGISFTGTIVIFAVG